MTEPPFHVVRQARDITAPPVKNDMYRWPQTGTYTLQPLNIVTDFSETAHWEALKFRLTDCVYNADWWTEVPDNTNPVHGGPADYFFNAIVKKENWQPKPGGFLLLDTLIDIAGQAVVSVVNYESGLGVSAIRSSNPLPANQGYCLRFRVDGRSTLRRSAILEFSFGQFLLRLNTHGEAQLWQSPDLVNYGYVYSWQWAHSDQIHDRSHRIIIFPHGRNKIEFMASTSGLSWHIARWGIQERMHGAPGAGLYEIPGEIVFDGNGVPLITVPNNWWLRVSREFRPKIQISRLGFANGTAPVAQTWDSPIDVRGRIGQPFPPLAPIVYNIETDLNGCRGWFNVMNADTGQPWASDGASTRMQFTFGMNGIGDIPGPGLGSSRTPEMYNYSIDKQAFFFATPRQSRLATVSSITIDHGDSPEAERLSVTSEDESAYMLYKHRADIPLVLGDIETGIVYFEGTAFEVEASECPAQTPNALHIEASGMVDNLLRTAWSDTAPDFGIDTYDSQHRGWLAADVIRQCFESAGESPDNVVIEEENVYLKGFRLWNAPAAGGTRGSSDSGIGGGHDTSNPLLGRWHPRPGAAIHEFTDFFIRSVLGWHWYRDRAAGKWRIYKRPDPANPLDNSKMTPKVEFTTSLRTPTGNFPTYGHSHLTFRTKRPRCSTILLATLMYRSEIPDRATLNNLLRQEQTGLGNPEDPILRTELKSMFAPFTNIKGYANPQNRFPDITHPDFLGQNRTVLIPAIECNTVDAVEWVGRRLFEDSCFGYIYGQLEADWGDAHTSALRKWDVVLLNGEKFYFHQAEPQWAAGKPHRAHYTLSKWRPDAKPPR
jgi:hypothetical protein